MKNRRLLGLGALAAIFRGLVLPLTFLFWSLWAEAAQFATAEFATAEVATAQFATAEFAAA